MLKVYFKPEAIYFLTNVVKNIELFLTKRQLTVFIALLISIVFIPFADPTFNIGLDPSYAWAFNYLYDHDYNALTHIIYPYGTLGFIKNPFNIGSNFLLFYLFETLIRFVFNILFLKLGKLNKQNVFLSILLLAFINTYYILDYFIYGIYLLVFISNGKWHNLKSLAPLAVLLAFSISIKFNIGFNVLVFSSLFFVVYFLKSSLPLKQKLGNILAFYAVLIITGSLLYKGIFNFIKYCFGTYKLSMGYNEAMALNTPNNWLLITLYLVCMAFILMYYFKKVGFYFIPAVAFLFFNWKHTMVREDLGHYYNIVFATLFLCLLLLVYRVQKKVLYILLSAGSIFCISLNGILNGAFGNYNEFIPSLNFNFYKNIVFDRKFLYNSDSITYTNFSRSKIEDSIAEKIGKHTLDCYPWELSYISANKFNYLPRNTLQSGANSSWLDGISKTSIEANKTEYYLFHSTNPGSTFYFGSLDGRCVLNDEPQTIFYLLNYYKPVSINNAFTLLKLQSRPNFTTEKTGEEKQASFNEWINVNSLDTNTFSRLKLSIPETFAQKTKALIYRPNQYYISYKYKNDSVATFRFTKANAVDGLWVSPFLINFKNRIQTKQIKITCSDSIAVQGFSYSFTGFSEIR